MYSFKNFIHNKLTNQREQLKADNLQKLMENDKNTKGTFIPTINKNSERLMLNKNKEVYRQRSKSRKSINRSSSSFDNNSNSIYKNDKNPYKRQKNN